MQLIGSLTLYHVAACQSRPRFELYLPCVRSYVDCNGNLSDGCEAAVGSCMKTFTVGALHCNLVMY
jgi:hypothetical protein